MSQVCNIAHRGARSLVPENTLAAARKAWEIGADRWETDVTVTADGQLILLHDDSLVRTTNVQDVFPRRSPWIAATFELAEIRQLDVSSWFEQTDPFGQIAAGLVSPADLQIFHHERIPTVRQALILTQELDWSVNLEIKPLPAVMQHFPIVPRLLELMDELNIEQQRVIISSFNHAYLHQVRQQRPALRVQALVGALDLEPNPPFDTFNAWADAVKEKQIQAAISQGITVNLYTVNKESEMRRFMAAGVSGIFTDFPQRLKALIDG